MSLHENSKDRPVERQADETVPSDGKRIQRLYPSLPKVERYEVCLLDRSIEENLHTAAVYHPDTLLGDTQSEASASNDVRLKAQILILEGQRQELLSINEKWAKEYRTMKQYYKKKVKDLKSLLQHDHSRFEEEMCGVEKNITLYKQVKDKESARAGDAIDPELLKAETEAKELRSQNSTLTRRWKHQHEEIRRLNEALEEALRTTPPLDVRSETLQDVWKHQAEVYKEDFLKERKDREKLKEKYLELEEKFRKVHSELRVLKPQVTRTQPPQRVFECTCANQAKCPRWEVRQINLHHMQSQRCSKHS
uniref:TNFAIP3-interacting protein 3-like n=1 Tax=Scatophagus argus TaxID=75038 RepID=UPI001ED838B9|nr:TNFAIP3-interacting protein 3-like [Scatophagus argus]